MSTENIIVETRGRVGLIRLNRPSALNALNRALMHELAEAVDAFETDGTIGCIFITGSDKAFAAGADIKEMADKNFTDAFSGIFPRTGIARGPASRSSPRSPVLRSAAAASSPCNATSLSRRTMPSLASRKSSRHYSRYRRYAATDPCRRQGEGDGPDPHRPHDGRRGSRTLRLRRACRAAREPLRRGAQSGRNNRVDVAAVGAGGKGGGQSRLRDSLAEGMRFERRIFHSLFATADQKEGMSAFVEKRPAKFENK